MAGSPLVVLIEPPHRRHHHADTLSRAGFQVVQVAAQDTGVESILGQRPSLVAAELVPTDSAPTWAFVRRFREDPATRFIPLIVFGDHLRLEDIEAAARSGALWLQLEPSNGARLVAAARGLVAAASKATRAS